MSFRQIGAVRKSFTKTWPAKAGVVDLEKTPAGASQGERAGILITAQWGTTVRLSKVGYMLRVVAPGDADNAWLFLIKGNSGPAPDPRFTTVLGTQCFFMEAINYEISGTDGWAIQHSMQYADVDDEPIILDSSDDDQVEIWLASDTPESVRCNVFVVYKVRSTQMIHPNDNAFVEYDDAQVIGNAWMQ